MFILFFCFFIFLYFEREERERASASHNHKQGRSNSGKMATGGMFAGRTLPQRPGTHRRRRRWCSHVPVDVPMPTDKLLPTRWKRNTAEWRERWDGKVSAIFLGGLEVGEKVVVGYCWADVSVGLRVKWGHLDVSSFPPRWIMMTWSTQLGIFLFLFFSLAGIFLCTGTRDNHTLLLPSCG